MSFRKRNNNNLTFHIRCAQRTCVCVCRHYRRYRFVINRKRCTISRLFIQMLMLAQQNNNKSVDFIAIRFIYLRFECSLSVSCLFDSFVPTRQGGIRFNVQRKLNMNEFYQFLITRTWCRWLRWRCKRRTKCILHNHLVAGCRSPAPTAVICVSFAQFSIFLTMRTNRENGMETIASGWERHRVPEECVSVKWWSQALLIVPFTVIK